MHTVILFQSIIQTCNHSVLFVIILFLILKCGAAYNSRQHCTITKDNGAVVNYNTNPSNSNLHERIVITSVMTCVHHRWMNVHD